MPAFIPRMGIQIERDESGIMWVVFTPEGHRPPLLTGALFTRLKELLEEVTDRPPHALVFTGLPGEDFQVGVSLDEMAAVPDRAAAHAASRRGQLLFEGFARAPFPTIAAVEGRCLGGGLELALACSARLAADEDDTAFAFPEIHIGILPGFGGSQRLPRLIGQRHALDMVLTGQRVGSRRAYEWGLVDRLVPPEELITSAEEVAEEMAIGRWRSPPPGFWKSPWGRILDGTGPGRWIVRNRYRKAIQKRTGGHLPAPSAALRAMGEAAGRLPMEEGLRREADRLADLVASPVHGHLLELVRSRQRLRARGEDGAESLRLPEDLADRVAAALGEAPGAPGRPAPTGELPTLETPGGHGVLRRTPAARSPGCAEVVWVPAAGAPEGFPEAARDLVIAAGLTPVFCYLAEPSPALSLMAAYVGEGERLRVEGWSDGSVDRVLERWGFASGPFRLLRRLGPGWERRLRDLPAARMAASEEGTHPAQGSRGDPLALLESVVSALVLQMARDWDLVAEPVRDGWSALEVFALGAPPFRGGVLGAARTMGADRVERVLEGLKDRWGIRYAPTPLRERGLLLPQGPPSLDQMLEAGG